MYFICKKRNVCFLFCLTLRFKEKKREKGREAGGGRVKGSVILTTLADLSRYTP